MSQSSRKFDSGILTVALLVAAGIGALAFTLITGFVVYNNGRNLVAAMEHLEHTQEVLTSVATASNSVDRIEFHIHLYAESKSPAQLELALSSASDLEAVVLHLKTFLRNPDQIRRAGDLSDCASNLSRNISALPAQGQFPESPLLQCRETLGLMAKHSRRILAENTASSQRRSLVSVASWGSFIGVALITLVVLFGFLIRDAVFRRRLSLQTDLANEHLKITVQALEENVHQARLLAACRDELQLCADVQQAYRSAARHLSRLLPGSSGALCMINHSRNLVESVSSWNAAASPSDIAETFALDACCGLRLGRLRWRRSGVTELDCSHFLGAPADRYLCIPMAAQGDTLGVLCIECVEAPVCLAVEQRMDSIFQLVQLTSMSIASLNLRTRLENQSIHDSLTGLFNRHFMQIVLERELSRASRNKTSLAVFMLDVDHFKRFNDTYGHGAGDSMLKAVADVFQANVRAEDVVCRYGGEEFAIILPNIAPDIAFERAELIRRTVAGLRVALGSAASGVTTVSIGIAFYPNDATEADPLLRKADQALYQAKNRGRDQVSLASVPSIA